MIAENVLPDTPDLVGTTDADRNVTYLNTAARMIAGRSDDDDLSEITVCSFHPAWACRLIHDIGFPTAERDGHWMGKTAVLAPNGDEIPMSQVIIAHRASNGTLSGFSTIMRDTSMLENMCRENNLRAAAVDSSGLAIGIGDIDGTLRYVNTAFLDLWGAEDTGSVLGRPIFEFFADTDEAKRVIETVNSVGEWLGELVGRHRDGSARYLFVTARVIPDDLAGESTVMATFTDVSAHQMTKRKLQAQVDRFEAFLRTTHDGYWLVGTDRIIREVNDAACYLLGYTRDELVGMSINDIDVIEDEERTRKRIEAISRTGSARFETKHRRKDGAIIDVDISVTVLTDNDAGGTLMIGFISDITEKKRSEQAEQARRVAEEANAAKTKLLSHVTHELRTPLNAVIGFGQLLQMDPQLDESQLDMVNEIIAGGGRLLRLIDRILDFARAESGALDLVIETVQLDIAVGYAVDELQPATREKQISLDARGVLHGAVLADRARLQQVVLSLISNAIEYSPRNSTVQITTTVETTSMELSVIDSGKGIPDDARKNLFTSFDRLGKESGSVSGVGLSLAYARKILDAMGGQIGVESKAGSGNRFWIRLPLSDAPETDSGDHRR